MDTSADRITDVWGSRTPYGAGASWPSRTDTRLAAGLKERREDDRLVECDRDTAMNRITARTRELLDVGGPGSIGLYTSGQLFSV